MEAFIAFGSNLGDRYAILRDALRLVGGRVGPIIALSRIYETFPLVLPGRDPGEFPKYLNAVMSVGTGMSPEELLQAVLEIERELGRDRDTEVERWLPRVVDLDIIAMEQTVVSSQRLKIPHAEMHRRDFVLQPLSDIAPDWSHPILRQTTSQLLSGILSPTSQETPLPSPAGGS